MRFSIEDITEASLLDIPEPCRRCIYWEFPEDFEKAKEEKTESEKGLEFERKKREWFVRTIREFGTCGKIVYCNDKPLAYAQFAPSERLPNTVHYESQPVGKLEEGVVFLSCLYVADKESRGKGLGEALLKNIIDDLRRRGFKAIETFARRESSDNPSGPLRFYIKNGFTIKDQTNAEFPLVRLYLWDTKRTPNSQVYSISSLSKYTAMFHFLSILCLSRSELTEELAQVSIDQ